MTEVKENRIEDIIENLRDFVMDKQRQQISNNDKELSKHIEDIKTIYKENRLWIDKIDTPEIYELQYLLNLYRAILYYPTTKAHREIEEKVKEDKYNEPMSVTYLQEQKQSVFYELP